MQKRWRTPDSMPPLRSLPGRCITHYMRSSAVRSGCPRVKSLMTVKGSGKVALIVCSALVAALCQEHACTKRRRSSSNGEAFLATWPGKALTLRFEDKGPANRAGNSFD
jgi:hypothetical protein